MCKVYAYCRVSTSDKSAKQDYERQKYLLEHSGIEFDEIFEEHISGGVKGSQREQFNKMLEKLGEKSAFEKKYSVSGLGLFYGNEPFRQKLHRLL